MNVIMSTLECGIAALLIRTGLVTYPDQQKQYLQVWYLSFKLFYTFQFHFLGILRPWCCEGQSSLVKVKRLQVEELKSLFPSTARYVTEALLETPVPVEPSDDSNHMNYFQWGQEKNHPDCTGPESWEIIKYYCFIPLSFAMFCYTAIGTRTMPTF